LDLYKKDKKQKERKSDTIIVLSSRKRDASAYGGQ
jgi:hypothetical protein